MGINTTEQSIKLEPVNAYFGKKFCRTHATVADSADSLQDTYHDLNWVDADFNEVEGYYYFDTDPVIAGKTAIGPVARTTGDDAVTIATAIKTAIDASDAFVTVSIASSVLTIENRAPFRNNTELDSGSTGFVSAVLVVGSGEDLGYTAAGGSSVELSAETFEIFADQTGMLLHDEILMGTASSLSAGFIELSQDKLKLLIGSAVGDVITGSTSDIVGYGESRLYQSLAQLGGMLILRPVRLKGQSDYSGDVVFHKCAPKTQDINYSGTEQQVLNCEFKPYLDSSINTKVNLISFGDWTQDEILA